MIFPAHHKAFVVPVLNAAFRSSNLAATRGKTILNSKIIASTTKIIRFVLSLTTILLLPVQFSDYLYLRRVSLLDWLRLPYLHFLSCTIQYRHNKHCQYLDGHTAEGGNCHRNHNVAASNPYGRIGTTLSYKPENGRPVTARQLQLIGLAKVLVAPGNTPAVCTFKMRVFHQRFVFFLVAEMETLRYEIAKVLVM